MKNNGWLDECLEFKQNRTNQDHAQESRFDDDGGGDDDCDDLDCIVCMYVSQSGCECLFICLCKNENENHDNSYTEGDFFFRKKESYIKWLSYGIRIVPQASTSVSELTSESLFQNHFVRCFCCCFFSFDLRIKFTVLQCSAAVQLVWHYSVITAIMSEIKEDVCRQKKYKQQNTFASAENPFANT